MPLSECMQKHTWRQAEAFSAWLLNEWNRPNRHDWYIMALISVVVNIGRKKEDRASVADMKLLFKAANEVDPDGLTKEQFAEAAEAVWRARIELMGGKIFDETDEIGEQLDE